MNELELDFEQIYEENHPKITRLCLGYSSGDSDLANDLVQEVFIKVWHNLKSFRKESTINTWIYRIAINTCLMNLRENKSKPLYSSLAANDEQSEEEITLLKEKQYQEMYRCINLLGATNKAIILMELEGLPQREIADVMGLKHEAIRTRIHRIKTQLSKCVNHE